MPNVNDLKTSKFLTKGDVMPDVLVTFKSYEQTNVAMENQPTEDKYVFFFVELEKPLVMNSTNGQLVEMILGSGDFDDWMGKQIVLFNDPTVSFAGKLTGGIRVRASKKGQPGRGIDDLPSIDEEAHNAEPPAEFPEEDF